MRHIDPNHPYPSLGQLYVFEKDEKIVSEPTSRVTELTGIDYNSLIDILGEPTYDTPSADEKVQKEWVVKYVPKDLADTPDSYIFRIYDYKTGSAWTTMTSLKEWSVGGIKGSNHVARELAELVTKLNHIKEL